MRLLIYVDRGEKIGYGHVRRCEALADECKKHGWQCDIFSAEADIAGYDAMVVDSYTISPEKIREFSAQCGFLIGFHDFDEPNTDFSLLISGVYRDSTAKGKTRILAGHEYKLIHPDIKAVQFAPIAEAVSSIIVSFGGTRTMGDEARAIAKTLAIRFPGIRFQAVAGASGAEIAGIFSGADIAVSGGGQTMFELLYLGVPTVVVVLSSDQEAQVAEAAAGKAVRTAGSLHDPASMDKIAESLVGLYSKAERQALSDAGRALIDGKGAERVVAAIEELFS